MINRKQHLMIFGLYTLFSIFMGVVFITFSGSYYTGGGCFFILLLLFVSGHLFMIGREVISKITMVLYDVEDNNNYYQQEIASLQEISSSVRNVVNDLVNENEQLSDKISETEKSANSQILELKSQIEELMFENQKLLESAPSYNQSFNQNMSDPFTDDMQDPFALDEIDTAQAMSTNKNTAQKNLDFDMESDFFAMDNQDDSFADLSIPGEMNNPMQNHHQDQYPLSNSAHLNIQNLDDDEEFAVVNQSDIYGSEHAVTAAPQEVFDIPQSKEVRKQLNMISDAEDEFAEITQHLDHSVPKAPVSQYQQPVNYAQNHIPEIISSNMDQHIPSMQDLVPGANISGVSQPQQKLPSLDNLISQNKAQSENIKETSQEIDADLSAPQVVTSEPQNTEIKKNNPLTEIYKAIDNNSFELLIRPITDNIKKEVCYFEAYNALNTQNGSYLDIADFDHVIQTQEGLSETLDKFLIFNAIKALQNVIQTIPEGAIFCNVSLISITDNVFFAELYQLFQEKLWVTERLILEFSQKQLGQLSSIRIERLQQFANLGVRFSIDNVHKSLPDIAELAEIGISFIKIKATSFANGLETGDNTYFEGNIAKICHQTGIALGVEDIIEHDQLLIAIDYGADILQGDLLGKKDHADKLAVAIEG